MSIALLSTVFASPTTLHGKLGRQRLWILLFLLASSIFLFADAKVSPLALQDEARNAINALEMYLRGPSLVTTFNFQPDLWNTKPPLLIWLISASMALFGPSEWAIRLPSALAALGILISTLLFARRVTQSLPVAITAASLLVLSPGFFGEHGARTADFDATLTFFVTVALQLIFFAVHQSRPRMRSMVLIGALVALGALTKSIAAFIPVAGVVVYLITLGRLERVLSLSSRYAVAVAVSIVPLLIFYALREAAQPGYLSAVMYNDVTGRFSEGQIRETNALFYLTTLPLGWFAAGPFILAAPLALPTLRGRTRLVFIYAASIVAFSLFVYSAAANRALQYALPIFPWLALIAALTLRHLVRLLVETWGEGSKATAIGFGGALGLAGVLLIFQAADWRYRRFPERDFYPQSSYGDLFADLATRGVRHFTIIEPGYGHFGKPAYAPLLRWHQLIWQEKGLTSKRELKLHPGVRAPLASCQPSVIGGWTGPGMERIGSCAVLWHLPNERRTQALPAAD